MVCWEYESSRESLADATAGAKGGALLANYTWAAKDP